MDSQNGQAPSVQPDIGVTDGVENGVLFDVVVIGGGPAGVAAAVYTARKQLRTLVIADSFGGQSLVSDDIQNWIGESHIPGIDLAKKLEDHVRAYPDIVEIKTEKAAEVKSVECTEDSSTPEESVPATSGVSSKRVCDFEVKTESGNTYHGKTVIVASGARRRKLGIPGEDKFGGKGVAYCSTCDAPLFKGKNVAVAGGGNAGLEAVQDLFKYANEIYLLEHGDVIRGDAKTLEEIKKNPRLKEIILNVDVTEILGDSFITGVKLKDSKTGSERVVEIGGLFVEIGSVPNSEMVKDLVQLDDHKQIMVNFQFARTSCPGVFAAGDVTDDPYKQNNISAGDGVRAALAAYAYIQNREKKSPAAEQP